MDDRETDGQISKGSGRMAWLLIGIIIISLGIAAARSGSSFVELAIIPLGIVAFAFIRWPEG